MKNNKVPFTPDEIAKLAANPYTLSVNEYQIRYTVAFKKYVLAEHEAHGTPWKEIFRKAGYDPDILKGRRIESTVANIRREAASERGLHETASSKKFADQDLEKQRMKTAIRDLQKEVIRQGQMIEFLKKTLQLNAEEDS